MTCFHDKCSVCLKIIGKAKITLPCGHTFHIHCGTKWLIGTVTPSPSCPDCRNELREEDDFVAKPENSMPPAISSFQTTDTYSSTFAVGTREQIHRFLVRKGGHGISDDEWAMMHSQMFLQCIESNKLVFNYYELYMLAVLNGCDGINVITDVEWHVLSEHNNWEEGGGIEINDFEEEIDDGGSEMHFPFN
jgi:hypothetical protein